MTTNQHPQLFRALAAGAIALLAWTAGPPAEAKEYWEELVAPAVPWVEPEAITSFDGKVFVAARQSTDNSSTRLWSYVDGNSWTPVPGVGAAVIETFGEHDGALFGFAVQDPDSTRTLYRTQGDVWEQVNGVSFGTGTWSSAVSFNGVLYAAASTGRLWQINVLENGGVQTQEVTSQFGFEDKNIHTARWVGLHIHAQRLYFIQTDIYRVRSGVLDRAGRVIPMYLFGDTVNLFDFESHGAFASWGEHLYLGVNSLYRGIHNWDDAEIFSIVSEELPKEELTLRNPIPITLGGSLYAFSPYSPPWKMTGLGNWQLATDHIFPVCPSRSKLSNRATLGNSEFVLFCNVWRRKSGAVSVSPKAFPPGQALAGQDHIQVLAWSARLNGDDRLTRVSVRNLGTAEAGADITRVTLNRFSGVDQATLEAMVDLSPEPDRTWRTPASLALPVTGDTDFFLTVELAPGAQAGKTLLFSLLQGGVQWQISSQAMPAFPLASQDELSIVPASAGEVGIDGVMVYPSPAMDTVRFLYELLHPGRVEIRIYDRNGLLVKELTEDKPANPRSLTLWDASGVAPGVYFATIEISPSNEASRSYKRKVMIKSR